MASGFAFTISPPRLATGSCSSDDEAPVLLLKEFEKPPIVSFGCVSIDSSKSAVLTVQNPNKVDLDVTVEKVPNNDGFTVNVKKFKVPAKDQFELVIQWKPTTLGKLRRSIRVDTNFGQMFQFHVQGHCVLSNANKNKGTKSKKKMALKLASLESIPKVKSISMVGNSLSFLDGNLQDYENVFRKLNEKNPLPSTPIRRETFCITSDLSPKRGALQNISMYNDVANKNTNSSFIGGNLNCESADVNLEKHVSARKMWSPVNPLQLPQGIKGSLSVSSIESSKSGLQSTQESSETNFEDSLDEVQEPRGNRLKENLAEGLEIEPSKCVPEVFCKSLSNFENRLDLEQLRKSREKTSTMYRLIQNRLNSTRSITTEPSITSEKNIEQPIGLEANIARNKPLRSFSDSSMPSSSIALNTISSDSPGNEIELQDERDMFLNRRTSTTKKESCNRGTNRELSHFSGSLIERQSSSGSETQSTDAGTPNLNLNEFSRVRQSRKLVRAKSFSLKTVSPKKSLARFMSPKKSNTGRVQRSKPFTSFAKPFALPKLNLIMKTNPDTYIPQHPNMFAAKNMFYDERWHQKEERAFTCWLNYVFSPPDGLSIQEDDVKISINWVKSLQSSNTKHQIQVAPSKETLSLKLYTSEQQRNKLRRSACQLFQSDPVIVVLRKLEQEISKERISIREDRHLNADFGLKQVLLNLLLCYNPLWLQIGLETIFGECIYLQKTNEVTGLSRFIIQRFLYSPEIATEFAHKTVPNLFINGYDKELRKFILKKFLFLVLFLDKAKNCHLIEHDPCLFNKKAKIKVSKELLTTFSREFLKGEGDIIRHLHQFGYSVSWQQQPLEEFDFSVTNLSQDLRCGTRLGRLCELVFHFWALTQRLRVPAPTKTIKIRNVENVFKALKEAGVNIPECVKPSDIVEGHRENTLALLWAVIYNSQVQPLIADAKLTTEVLYLFKSLRLKQKERLLESFSDCLEEKESTGIHPMYQNETSLRCLLRWCQIICEHYSLKIENFTVSFSDGRAFCFIIHHYHPIMLPRNLIKEETLYSSRYRLTSESTPFEELPEEQSKVLLLNEKHNLRTAFDKMRELGCIPIVSDIEDISNTIPDEKVIITLMTYLYARLTNLGREIRAARTIQLYWKNYRFEKKKKLLKIQNEAATKIQQFYRIYAQRKKVEKQTKAAVIISRYYRMYKARKILAHLKKLKIEEDAAIKIQATIRGYLTRKSWKRTKTATVTLQAAFRGLVVRKRLNREIRSASIIQKWFRLQKKKLAHKAEVESAKLIQRCVRSWLQRRRFLKMKSAVIRIQCIFRAIVVKKRMQRESEAALKIQHFYKAYKIGKKERREYLLKKEAITVIQSCIRAWIVRKKFRKSRHAAVILQSAIKGFRARKNFLSLKAACIKIQHYWKAILDMRKERKQYLLVKESVAKIQKCYRAYKVNKKEQQDYLLKAKAATIVQSYYRMWIAKRQFLRIQRSTLVIQSALRAWQCRQHYDRFKSSSVKIQRLWRATLKMRQERKQFALLKDSTIKIQVFYRAYKLGQIEQHNYFLSVKAITVAQSCVRRWIARRNFSKVKHSALILQSTWRGLRTRRQIAIMKSSSIKIQRVWRATLQMRKERKQFLQYRAFAVKIQNFYRAYKLGQTERQRYLLKKKSIITLQSFLRSWSARRKLRQFKNSALIIQSAFRGFQTRKELDLLKTSSVKIQKRWRATLVMRNKRKYFLLLCQSAIKIQRFYRAFKVGQKQRSNYCLMIKSVTIIQACVRRFAARKQFLNARNAAVKIQSAARGFATRKKFQTLKAACIIVQRHWRAFKLGQNQRLDYCLMIKSATIIQSCVRRFAARKQFFNARNAVVKIQSATRMFATRRKFQTLKAACILVQRHWRAKLKMKRDREKYLLINESVCKIQTFYRAIKIGQKERQMYNSKLHSITRVQSHIRKWLAMRRFKKNRHAAVRIQSIFKGFKARRNFKTLKTASITIQRYWRATLEMRKEHNQYLHLKTSVVKIQSAYKGSREREKFKITRKAALTIQKLYRAILSMRKERKQFLLMKQSAIKIQSSYRRYVSRKDALHQAKAATIIQAAYRSYRNRNSFQKLQMFTLMVQRRFRAKLEVKRQRAEFLSKKQAASLIQSRFRAFQHRKTFLNLIHKVIKIQAIVRGFLVRRRCIKIDKAVCLIQRKLKATLLMQKEKSKFAIKKNAVLKIQACFRKFLERKNHLRLRERMLVERRTKAAIRIQKTWKGYILRKQEIGSKMSNIRTRLVQANEHATDDKTLGKLSLDAMRAILSGRTKGLVQSLMHIEKSIRLSPYCRQQMMDNDFINYILNLMRSCNRSLPHIEVLTWCSNILLNFAIFDNTMEHLYNGANFLETSVDMMKRFQERDTIILNKMATLLNILCEDDVKATEFKKDERAMKNIQNLHDTLARKFVFKQKTMKFVFDSHKCTGCAGHTKKENERRRSRLAWYLGNEFDNPTEALDQLRKTLKI